MSRADYPKHAYASAREFKQVKRAHIKAALKAVNDLRMGCYYLPNDAPKVPAIFDALEALKDACSVKKWGR